jgi:hypothetical protein
MHEPATPVAGTSGGFRHLMTIDIENVRGVITAEALRWASGRMARASRNKQRALLRYAECLHAFQSQGRWLQWWHQVL